MEEEDRLGGSAYKLRNSAIKLRGSPYEGDAGDVNMNTI